MTIISGGQTGADQAGLRAARAVGFRTGGYAPVGWFTEDGPQPALLQGFGLVECDRPGYAARTFANVEAATGHRVVWT
ncbi:MAG: YpsA SLOG family protein [Terriglobia bacterium]